MRDEAVTRARRIIAGLLAGPLLLVAIVLAAGGESREAQLDMPAMLAGLISLPIAWRLHETLIERARQLDDEGARIARFVRAIVIAMTITALASLFGVAAHAMSREMAPLIGVAMHVLLGGLLWPSRERLDAFLDEPDPAQS